MRAVARTREAAGREASPSAGEIDSQSVKTTEAGGPRGQDVGKQVKGRKRHILVGAVVHPADVQDRDGAPEVLDAIRHLYPCLHHVFADGDWSLEIVKRSDTAKGFALLPRRWVIEGTLAWRGRNRRLAEDFEAAVETAVTWLCIATSNYPNNAS